MQAQFEAQDKFADNQNERDLGTLTAQGEQVKAQIQTQGQQDQLLAAKKGEMDNSLAKIQGEYNITGQKIGAQSQENIATTQADASKYGADRALDATKDTNQTSTKNIKVTGNQTRKTMETQDQLDASKANRQSARSRSMARAF